MKKESTQKKFVALFATVCAFVLLLVGIPFAAAPASAAETRGTYIPTNPTFKITDKYYAAVRTHYYGDIDATETYMHLGTSVNTNGGYEVVDGYDYSMIEIPINSAGSVYPQYKWIRAYTKVNNIVYQSDTYYTYQRSWASGLNVHDFVTNGTLSTTTRTESCNFNGKTAVNATFVYNGKAVNFNGAIPADGQSAIQATSPEIDGYKLTVTFYQDHYDLRLTKGSGTITCAQYSSEGSYLGGFAFTAF